MPLVNAKGERGTVVTFVDVDAIFVVGGGWFSDSSWAVELDGSGRVGRGLTFCGQFNSID